jgi:hypothetical protein
MDFNINELKKIQNDKHENRKKVFVIVLQQCIKRVKYISKNSNSTEFWFTIPKLIIGQPLFNIEKCSEFLLEELNTLGFKTNYIQPDNIHISWKYINESSLSRKKLDNDNDNDNDNDFNMLEGLNFNCK